MKRFLVAALAGIGLAATLWGSGVGAADNARVRVIHASPDAPNVDVYANGNRVLSNVPYKAASDYLSVPAGTYKLEVFAAGTTANPVISIDAPLAAGKDYTVVALDRVATLKNRVFVDNNAAPAAGKAHIQVIHAGSDAPAVDVAVKGGPVLVKDISFGEQQGPLPVDAGRYDLELRVAGTSTVALPLNGVQLEAGKVYTFVASGFLNGQPALSVFPAVFTPAAAAPSAPTSPVAPPHTGEAGLAAASDSNAWLLPVAAVALLTLGGVGALRLATRKHEA
ncbi:MAG: DUF4397 domain-containing protein [Dehalococcoidia bacterium]